MDLSPTEAIEKVLGAGMDADFEELWACVKSSVNARTEQDQWTALMVACGSPLDTSEFIRNVIVAGADVAAVDGDGWTALHWCAFHGRPEAAATVLENAPAHKIAEALEIRALDNRLAVEIAREEGHIAVEAVISKFASILEMQALSDASSSLSGSSGDEEEPEEPAVQEKEETEGDEDTRTLE